MPRLRLDPRAVRSGRPRRAPGPALHSAAVRRHLLHRGWLPAPPDLDGRVERELRDNYQEARRRGWVEVAAEVSRCGPDSRGHTPPASTLYPGRERTRTVRQTSGVPPPQNSAMLTPAAHRALWRLTSRWQVSRDATVRRLLTEFVDEQRAREEDERLTHLTTVVGYPRCLLDPGASPSLRLTFRAERDLLDEVRALAHRLPGKAGGRAHPDYASRPVADALATALTAHEEFVDDGMEDLPPVVTVKVADDLWRLVVAGTLTQAEREGREESNPDLRWLLRVAGVAWHSPIRSALALHMARLYFTGAVDEGDNPFLPGASQSVFNATRDWIEASGPGWGLHEHTDGANLHGSTAEGRGATLVWRARRSLAQERLLDAVVAGDSFPFTMDPMQWVLDPPKMWQRRPVPLEPAPLPATLEALVASGAVLRMESRGRGALWPWLPDRGPVPGFSALNAGAHDVEAEPLDLIEAILLTTCITPAPSQEQDERVVLDEGSPWPKELLDIEPPLAGSTGRVLSVEELFEAVDGPVGVPPLPDIFTRHPGEPEARAAGVGTYDDDVGAPLAWLAQPFAVTATDAFDAGLIDAEERDHLEVQAQRYNSSVVEEAFDRLREKGDDVGSEDLDQLRAFAGNVQALSRFCVEKGLSVPAMKVASVEWTVTSLVDLLDPCASADQRRARSRVWCRRVRTLRETDMENAWRAAMWRGRKRPPEGA